LINHFSPVLSLRFIFETRKPISGQDKETGLYYYGARYYEPRMGIFLSVDGLTEKYPHISGYAYTANNPVNAVDPNGKDIIFINGYIGFGSPPSGQKYWSSNFVSGAKDYFNDRKTKFTSFEPKAFSSAAERKAAGVEYAKANLAELTKGMDKGKDSFKFVTHSMGAAFGEGIAEYLKGEGWKVEAIVQINAYQASDIETIDPKSNQTETIDYQNPDDIVINTPIDSAPGDIKGADAKVREKSGESDVRYRHTSPIWKQGRNFWDTLKEKILKLSPQDNIRTQPSLGEPNKG
jgi:RHS repeat-associated protein